MDYSDYFGLGLWQDFKKLNRDLFKKGAHDADHIDRQFAHYINQLQGVERGAMHKRGSKKLKRAGPKSKAHKLQRIEEELAHMELSDMMHPHHQMHHPMHHPMHHGKKHMSAAHMAKMRAAKKHKGAGVYHKVPKSGVTIHRGASIDQLEQAVYKLEDRIAAMSSY